MIIIKRKGSLGAYVGRAPHIGAEETLVKYDNAIKIPLLFICKKSQGLRSASFWILGEYLEIAI
ncbi:hypothetical protein SAMN04488168_104149 [Bacillus sp. 491mf]|uniref:hypothetical protein n=1 Tax=unclassified Bacillus (in: firmicutes) TaxID=185979 RepID=UPI00054E99E4|nr:MULTISPECIES: hypothetical protein [unclassified Bacillus (in: firmicutes)]SFC40253.1 hypothetical protein SAMN04488168_104149 [Bacillus sp. 491mf]